MNPSGRRRRAVKAFHTASSSSFTEVVDAFINHVTVNDALRDRAWLTVDSAARTQVSAYVQ